LYLNFRYLFDFKDVKQMNFKYFEAHIKVFDMLTLLFVFAEVCNITTTALLLSGKVCQRYKVKTKCLICLWKW